MTQRWTELRDKLFLTPDSTDSPCSGHCVAIKNGSNVKIHPRHLSSPNWLITEKKIMEKSNRLRNEHRITLVSILKIWVVRTSRCVWTKVPCKWNQSTISGLKQNLVFSGQKSQDLRWFQLTQLSRTPQISHLNMNSAWGSMMSLGQ